MGKQSLEIDKVLILSVTHLTPEDRQDLFDEDTGLVVYSLDDYGWMVSTGTGDVQDPSNPKHSANMEKLRAFARANACQWLRFDVDANEIEGFEVFPE